MTKNLLSQSYFALADDISFLPKASLGYNIPKDFLHKFNVKAITSTKNKVKLLRIETPITIPFLKEHSKPQ
jgi:hypothetical protein